MGRSTFYYLMIPLMAVAALLQSTALTRLTVGGVKPDLVLLLVIIGTLLYGPRIGVVWAFIGGIFLDILSGGPMGSSSLALIAASLVAGVGHTTFSRFNLLVPLGAIAIGTIIYGVAYAAILLAADGLLGEVGPSTFRRELPFWETFQAVIVPATLYNTVLMLFLLPVLNRVPETPEAVSVL